MNRNEGPWLKPTHFLFKIRNATEEYHMRSETLQRAIIVQYFAKIAIFVIHFLNFISAYYFCGDEIIFGNHEIPT